MIFYNEFEFGKNGGVRAFTSARVNLSSILHIYFYKTPTSVHLLYTIFYINNIFIFFF